ncbi:S-adenosyl-L-methionine-dependent methyltransferase [Neofusicoccum parvum]|nr:S-adenosyl-L-methionine-dependent methyltransferase [Neofusicoccum parvum]
MKLLQAATRPRGALHQSLKPAPRPAASRHYSSTTDWNAANYLRFAAERTRPARDLLAQVHLPASAARRVVDLGCGPANSTALLAARFPGAQLTGVDGSPDMLARARRALPGARFVQADLREYRVPEGVDLAFSNAALHWLPEGVVGEVVRGVVEGLRPGGVFAMQVPDNLAEASHVAMGETARLEGAEWRGRFEGVAGEGRARVPAPGEWYDALSGLGEVDVWHTVYYHRLDGHEAIVAWLRESGLRPYLDAVGEGLREKFEAEYLKRIEKAYPLNADGSVLLRFPRLFVVCVRK